MNEALKNFIDISKATTPGIYDSLDEAALTAAADLIDDCRAKGGRVHITGIGKTAHVATYAAALLASTGTPAYYLHGTESVHGSCGQLMEHDIVISISNSGKTMESLAAARAVLNNGCRLIAITGNPESPLAELSAIHLFAGVKQEGGPLNRAPRLSILAEMIVIQALSIVLQERRDLTPQKYVTWHPGGALGQLRSNEK